MVCLTGKASQHRDYLLAECRGGEAIVGLWEPWASPWGEAGGRAGGRQGRREVLKHRQWWKRDACGKYKNLLLLEEKEKMRNRAVLLCIVRICRGFILNPKEQDACW